MSIAPTDDIWLSLDEFCAIADLTKGTVYNCKTRGKDLPPYYKIGRELRFRKSEVDAWLNAQRCVTAESKTAA